MDRSQPRFLKMPVISFLFSYRLFLDECCLLPAKVLVTVTGVIGQK
jgi:hypothetical protein